MKILIFFLLALLSTTNVLGQSHQKTNLSTPVLISQNTSDSTSASNITQDNQDGQEAKNIVARLENQIFWLALLAAFGFILPLPIGVYHIYRTRELVAQTTELEHKLNEQTTKALQIEPLIARNEKLENEIKQIQERFRVTMKNTQEKHQDTIEKMKNDLHLLDLENKRISGILMLKEQVAKKSFPGS